MSTKKKTPTKPDWKLERLPVKHTFTDAERIEKGLEANREYLDAANLETQLGSVKKDYQAKIEAATMRHNVALGKMTDGFEIRLDTECVVDFNASYDPSKKIAVPKPGRKVVWLHAGNNKRGEFVREDPMTEGDLQRDLPLPAPPKVEPKPGEPLNPVAAAFEPGKRKRAKQKVIEAEIISDDKLLNAPHPDPDAAPEEQPHITQPSAQ